MTKSDLAPRRIQYSSCDQCRRSRVACDAARVRSAHGSHSNEACSRCTNRQLECTFDWIKSSSAASGSMKRSPYSKNSSRLRNDAHTKHKPRPASRNGYQSSAGSLAQSIRDQAEDVCDPATTRWLHAIYEAGFETVFGSWMGKHSNPFLFGEQSPSEVCVSMSSVCAQLDKWMDEEYDFDDASPSTRRLTSTKNAQSLDLAITAFAARWLTLVDERDPTDAVQKLWRAARQDMLMVINRTSYRSMWTLLLFALTPIPVGVADEEASNGVSGQVCVHAALQQIQTLRARQRRLQFNGALVNPSAPPSPGFSTGPRHLATPSFIVAESIAYWAALTFDTSASLTLNCRPLLSSGLFGFSSESSWRMVRTCRGVFQQSASSWLPESEMTDDRANQIIAAASAWKLLVWKLTALMTEALRDGHDEPEVRSAFNAVCDAIEDWNSTYRDLLSACQKRILFLAQETKLRWYEVVMHYHLGVLICVDALTSTNRHDLLTQFATKRIEAESWVLNCLVFGLNNKYTITSATGNTTVSLIAVDPYAHHVVAAVKLMQYAIERDFAAAKIAADAYNDLVSTLTQALQQLPASSKSVQVARSNVPSQPLYSQTFMGG